MIWGAMLWRGVGPICKIDGLVSLHVNHGQHNTTMLLTICPRREFIDRITERNTKLQFQDKMVTLFNWPSCSPDLHPNENLWTHLKKRVRSHKVGNFQDLYDICGSIAFSFASQEYKAKKAITWLSKKSRETTNIKHV